MKDKKYKLIYYKDYTFIFKYEIGLEEMLHIWVRHTTEPKDAIKAFFEGDSIWNKENERFETTTKTHTVFWFWLDENNKKVMIITCFKS